MYVYHTCGIRLIPEKGTLGNVPFFVVHGGIRWANRSISLVLLYGRSHVVWQLIHRNLGILVCFLSHLHGSLFLKLVCFFGGGVKYNSDKFIWQTVFIPIPKKIIQLFKQDNLFVNRTS